LAYGNPGAPRPKYDIASFTNNIPDPLIEVKLVEEERVISETTRTTVPLFQDKTWLWIIIALIMVILGWFSIRMIREH
jgi:hypothetical protein